MDDKMGFHHSIGQITMLTCSKWEIQVNSRQCIVTFENPLGTLGQLKHFEDYSLLALHQFRCSI